MKKSTLSIIACGLLVSSALGATEVERDIPLIPLMVFPNSLDYSDLMGTTDQIRGTTPTATVVGGTEVSLSWTPSIFATSQYVFVSTDNLSYSMRGTALSGTATTTTVTGLTAGTQYYFSISPMSSVGRQWTGPSVSATTTAAASSGSSGGSSSGGVATTTTTAVTPTEGETPEAVMTTNADGTASVSVGENKIDSAAVTNVVKNTDGSKNIEFVPVALDGGGSVDPSIRIANDGSMTNTVSITLADGSKIENTVNSELAGADTKVAKDGSVTTTVGSKNDDGVALAYETHLSKDGTVANVMSFVDATTGEKMQNDIAVEIAGASTKFSKDGSMTTTSEVKNSDGTKVSQELKVDKTGGIDAAVTFVDATTGEKIVTESKVEIAGTDVKVDKTGMVTATTPVMKGTDGSTQQVQTVSSKSGEQAVTLSSTAADGTKSSIALNAPAGSKTLVTKDMMSIFQEVFEILNAKKISFPDGSKRSRATLSTIKDINISGEKDTQVSSEKLTVNTKVPLRSTVGSNLGIEFEVTSGAMTMTIGTDTFRVSKGQTVQVSKDGTFLSKTGRSTLALNWNLVGASVNKIINNPAAFYGVAKVFVFRDGAYVTNPAKLYPGEAAFIKAGNPNGVDVVSTETFDLDEAQLAPLKIGITMMSLPVAVTVGRILGGYEAEKLFTFDAVTQSWMTYAAKDANVTIAAGTGFAINPTVANGTVAVTKSWNLIGASDNTAMNTADIAKLGEYYVYRNGTYQKNPISVSSHEGVWLNATGSGTLKTIRSNATLPQYPTTTGWKLCSTPLTTEASKLLANTASAKMYIYKNGVYKMYTTVSDALIPAGSGFWAK